MLGCRFTHTFKNVIRSRPICHFFHRYTREIPEPAPFLSQHGAQIGGLRVFSVIKITMIRQVCICHLHLLWSEREDKTHIKCRTAREDGGRISFAFLFACVVSRNPKTPNFSPMADDTITLGGRPIQGLGFPLYICSFFSNLKEKILYCTFMYHCNFELLYV